MERVRETLRRIVQAVGEILYGMTLYEFVSTLRQARAYRERIFILTMFGDLLGVPILPPYYSLRLLPYIVPDIGRWRRSLLRERDLVDLIGGAGAH